MSEISNTCKTDERFSCLCKRISMFEIVCMKHVHSFVIESFNFVCLVFINNG